MKRCFSTLFLLMKCWLWILKMKFCMKLCIPPKSVSSRSPRFLFLSCAHTSTYTHMNYWSGGPSWAAQVGCVSFLFLFFCLSRFQIRMESLWNLGCSPCHLDLWWVVNCRWRDKQNSDKVKHNNSPKWSETMRKKTGNVCVCICMCVCVCVCVRM